MLLGQSNHWTCWCNDKDLVMIFFGQCPVALEIWSLASSCKAEWNASQRKPALEAGSGVSRCQRKNQNLEGQQKKSLCNFGPSSDDDLQLFLSKFTGKSSSNEHLVLLKVITSPITWLTNPTGLDCDSTGLERGGLGWVDSFDHLRSNNLGILKSPHSFLETPEKYGNFTMFSSI